MENEKKLWYYFMQEIKNPYAVAGLMGNIQAESNCNPENLQNTYETKLAYNDATYTLNVDNGAYPANSFIYDGAGYGLCQWTFWSRKKALLEFARDCKVSIGSLFMQADFCLKELKDYGLFDKLCKCKTIKDASDLILLKYEMPKDQSEKVKEARAHYANEMYNKYYFGNIFSENEEIKQTIEQMEKNIQTLKNLILTY